MAIGQTLKRVCRTRLGRLYTKHAKTSYFLRYGIKEGMVEGTPGQKFHWS